ncbi:CHAT domain-containing protein [Streptomyces sp. SM10]|uniref:CHAT domain-containing protein n=1 Tax=Streptomyces sp. SM10 TaxID=565556 RepID=UPI0011B055D0|nr:CHAT domain-containing protein [Streptomyces sp. SM10]
MTTASPQPSDVDRHLLYLVVFDPEDGAAPVEISPVIEAMPDEGPDQFSMPHSLARDVAQTLPGLWYCLHLPQSRADLVDLEAWKLKGLQQLAMGHHVVPIPVTALDSLILPPWWRPMLALCPDGLVERTAQGAAALGVELPVASFSSLGDASLEEHWRAIHERVYPDIPPLEGKVRLSRRLDVAALDLPWRFTARRMGWKFDAPAAKEALPLMRRTLQGHTLVAATARLERQGLTLEEAEPVFGQTVLEEEARLRLPIALALPGVAPAYMRGAYSPQLRKARVRPLAAVDASDTWSTEIGERDDAHVERAAIEYALTHRAVANDSLGLMMPSVPPSAFTILAELEKHFRNSPADRPRSVAKRLSRLNAVVRPLFTEPVMEAISRASMLTVFSNFPLGLATMPGDTAPLAARLPLTYEPLLPLTRTVQKSGATPLGIEWKNDIRVLVAECIPSKDPVGRISRAGWWETQDVLKDVEGLSIHTVETLSLEALRKAVDEHRPDLLIISAHGTLVGNLAAIVIGDEPHIELGLKYTPPVIVLSACHVAPRGASAVSITDLLLREGALAVLGTQVPVDVRRNMMLTGRLLTNLADHLTNQGRHATLLEVWHHTQTTNTVNDILMSTPSLLSWGSTPGPGGGLAPLQEFMISRSAGRLRGAHIYEDSEQVLGEIAEDQGRGEQVRNWFRRPGYVPESLFYLFAGRPERILISSMEERVAALWPDSDTPA